MQNPEHVLHRCIRGVVVSYAKPPFSSLTAIINRIYQIQSLADYWPAGLRLQCKPDIQLTSTRQGWERSRLPDFQSSRLAGFLKRQIRRAVAADFDFEDNY